MEVGNQGLRRETKDSKAKEEKKLRGEIKGAESASERNKMHEGENHL